MITDLKKKVAPPYVPYSTFTSFINGLRDSGIPSHIDRSIMNTMSGSGQSAMIATLKSLQLVNAELEPKPELKKLVNGSEDDFTTTMNALVKATYEPLFDGSINIENTTSRKVEEKFRNFGVSGSTLTKAISFFLAAMKASGIKVSPHVKAPKLLRKSSVKKKNDSYVQNGNSRNDNNENTANNDEMDCIVVPLRGMKDGVVYFPKGLDDAKAKIAVKMTEFILRNYYGIVNEEENPR